MLDFALLRAIVAVAGCGGFRRAAERLNLKQSTVSRSSGFELETKWALVPVDNARCRTDRRWRDAARRRESPVAT
jgi:hypothetical protein